MQHRSPAALHSSFFESKCKSEIFKRSSGTLQAFAYSSGARITWDVLQRVESSWEGWAMPNHFPSLDPSSSLMVQLKLFRDVEEYLENGTWLSVLSAIRSSRNKKMPSGSQWEFVTLSTFCYRRTFPYYSTPLKCCFSHLSDFPSHGQGRAEINARLYVASHMGIRTRIHSSSNASTTTEQYRKRSGFVRYFPLHLFSLSPSCSTAASNEVTYKTFLAWYQKRFDTEAEEHAAYCIAKLLNICWGVLIFKSQE